MKIALGCDHGALELKCAIGTFLKNRGYEVQDFGTHTKESCDYPDFAAAAAKAVAEGGCQRGVVLCTTGVGVSIAANKIDGVRCALVSDLMTARLTRQHNDSNVLALGAGVVGEKLALEIVDVWLNTAFEGGRHQRRVDKLTALENR